MKKQEAKNQYDELRKQILELEKQISPTQIKIYDLRKKLKDIYLKNKLFHSMNELKAYRGRRLSSITIYYFDESERKITERSLTGEYLQVKTNGRLDFSDYEQGILRYDEEKQCYKWWYHQYSTVYDIRGWDSLVLD